MSTNKLLILCFILCFLTIGGNALYFRIGETESKCFIEEILKDTLPLLVGKYKVEIFDKGQNKFVPTVSGLGMHVEIKDPDRKMVLSRTYSDQGQFSFTSHTSGEHTICLHSNSSAWFNSGQLRIHLDIQVGEHAQDYYAIAAKDKLTDLELRVRQLLDQVEQISKEQNYQRYREELFRRISESTNQRVLFWSILQTVILLGTGFWQMRHLKPYWNDSENPADATPPVPESLQTPRHQTKFDCSCCAAPCATLNE